jgi:hypothetical protein
MEDNIEMENNQSGLKYNDKTIESNIVTPLLILSWAFLFKSFIDMGMYIEYVKNKGKKICDSKDNDCLKLKMSDSDFALNLKNVIMSIIFLIISIACISIVMKMLSIYIPIPNFLKKFI